MGPLIRNFLNKNRLSNAFLGKSKPFPDPPKSASRKMNLIRTLHPSWRAALLGGGLGEGLPSPRKSIILKKLPSDLEILLSYGRRVTLTQ